MFTAGQRVSVTITGPGLFLYASQVRAKRANDASLVHILSRSKKIEETKIGEKISRCGEIDGSSKFCFLIFGIYMDV